MKKTPSKIVLYIDGGARGNPGPAGIGVAICDQEENILKKYSHYLGDNFTNNEAEYNALIFGLKKIKLIFGKKNVQDIKVKSDSKLLVKQMEGLYKISSPKIQPLFLEAWNLKIDFENIDFELVPREKNKIADKLVNEARDLLISVQLDNYMSKLTQLYKELIHPTDNEPQPQLKLKLVLV